MGPGTGAQACVARGQEPPRTLQEASDREEAGIGFTGLPNGLGQGYSADRALNYEDGHGSLALYWPPQP